MEAGKEEEAEMKLNCHPVPVHSLKMEDCVTIKEDIKTKIATYEGSLCQQETICEDFDYNNCQIKDELIEEVYVKGELLDLSDYETSIKNIEIEEEFVGTAVVQSPSSYEESSHVVMETNAEKSALVSKSQRPDSPTEVTKPGVSLTTRSQGKSSMGLTSVERPLIECLETPAQVKRCSIKMAPLSKGRRGDQDIFQCSECSYETKGKYQLKIHLLTHSQEKLFKCSDCDFSTNWKVELKAHEAKHSKIYFNCNQCHYETNHKYSMKNHQRKHTELKFGCTQCDYKTNWKAYMKIHSLSHLDKKLFKCSYCEYETNFKSHLKTHVLKHEEGKVWKCPECVYTTYVRHLLKLHLLKHSSVKLYKCSVCSYQTNRRSYMRVHYLKHSDKKLFRCSQCDYETNFRRQIRIHELRHAQRKLFQCSECSFETNLKKRLKLHSLDHGGPGPGPAPGPAPGQWIDEATRESGSYEQTQVGADTEVNPTANDALRRTHGGYEQTRWTLEDKKTILSCFEYSRFEGWGRQKGRVLEEQIEKCDLPPQKKGEGAMARISSLIPKITKFIPEEERMAIRDEARRKAREDLGTMDDGRKAEIKRGTWSLEEKWALVWAAEYARRVNASKRDYTRSWKELFCRLCPFKSDISINRLHTLRHTIRSRELFTPLQIKYMEGRIRHLLWYNLSPVQNPIPFPTLQDLDSVSSSATPSMGEEANTATPVIYLLVQCPVDSNPDSIDERLGEAAQAK